MRKIGFAAVFLYIFIEQRETGRGNAVLFLGYLVVRA